MEPQTAQNAQSAQNAQNDFVVPYEIMNASFDFSIGDMPGSTVQRSFSVASTASNFTHPFTPPPDRSSPGFVRLIVDHDNVGCGTMGMGITPADSGYGTSFSSNGASFSSNGPEASQYIDLGYSNTYMQQTISPPVDYRQPQYPTEVLDQYNPIQPWTWSPEDGHTMFFDPNAPAVVTTLNESNLPPPYFAVQQRTAALHNVQRTPALPNVQRADVLHKVQGNKSRISKRNRMPVVMVRRKTSSESNTIPALLCTTGKHKCRHPDCDRPPFKRQEHLKRHETTVHGDQDWVICEFCTSAFNRTDNYRTHLALHTFEGGRTKYFPEAKAVYDKEMSKTKKRKQSNKVPPRPRAARARSQGPRSTKPGSPMPRSPKPPK
ncbi:hypothetical protein F5Y12DRAFT_713272 [Xylaria sp. FL1777]|nr:hypothetical protein F5Y12DRAFT_713272 [Xylaria sp. FL1777]